MTFWIAVIALTVLALAILLFPLLRNTGKVVSRAEHDIAVYRAQLAELESEAERGVISRTQLENARLEIERRILAAGAESTTESPAQIRDKRPLALIATIAVLVPAIAVAGYLVLGVPGMPDLPFAERASEPAASGLAGGANITEMVETLARRLEEQGSTDPQGWQLLGRSYALLGRYGEAAKAYARAHELNPGDVDVTVAYGESLVFAEGGTIPDQALTLFRDAAKAHPDHPGVRYYLALAKAQSGDVEGALDDWVALAADTPADAGWRGELELQIRHAAGQLDRDVAALLPPSWTADAPATQDAPSATAGNGPGPTAEDIEAAAQMSANERQEMVRGMVAGLAARLEDNPADPAGWQRLIRAYQVLGETGKAREALEKAVRHNPGNADLQVLYAQTLMQGAGPGPVPEAAVTALDRALDVAPDHRQGLWLRGLAAESAGETDRAAALWRRLLDQLPADSADYETVAQRLRQLGN